jgi:hypothetical protein
MSKLKEDNIIKLRALVDELETNDSSSDTYKEILHKIESLIKEEIILISRLKKPGNKLKHYENICAGILTMISSTNV